MLTFTEICSLVDYNCGTNSTTYTLAEKARDANLASLKLQILAIQAEGNWQVDDANHTKYPILTFDLVANQRDYSFLKDEQDNVILDIYKVLVKDSGGTWIEMEKIDQQKEDSEENPVDLMLNGAETTGTPARYDKSWNGIFLDPIPNYSWRYATEGEQGIKILVNREHSYFVSGDTTKSLGFGHAFHEYIPTRMSYQRLRLRKPEDARLLYADIIQMEKEIKKYYSQRSKDEQLVITPKIINPI
jgi:hypothetical protein